MELILLTAARQQPTAEVLPALGLLPHRVTVLPLDAAALVDRPLGDAILVDARRDLAGGAQLHPGAGRGRGHHAGHRRPDRGWPDRPVGRVDRRRHRARHRRPGRTRRAAAAGRRARAAAGRPTPEQVDIGDLTIDETTYTARLVGPPLDLTYKEFELLKFLAQHPGRVFTRSHLVQEVWGYDYFGGTRTVDVHVRRLRAKLGPEHER